MCTSDSPEHCQCKEHITSPDCHCNPDFIRGNDGESGLYIHRTPAEQAFFTNKHRHLLEIIRLRSYKKGEFTLTSGRKSNFYFDGKQTTLHSEGCVLVGRLMLDLIVQEFKSNHDIKAVAGMTLGADPIVTSVAVEAFHAGLPSLHALIIRKEPKGHGTGAYIEGLGNVPAGSRVVLVEDVVTTGGTLITSAKRLEDAGLVVALMITIVDREEGGREALKAAGYDLRSIFTKTDVMALDNMSEGEYLVG